MLMYGEMMGYVYVTVGSFIGICTYTHTHTHTHTYTVHTNQAFVRSLFPAVETCFTFT